MDCFRDGRSLFAVSPPSNRHSLVFGEVAGRPIEPGNNMLRRRVRDRQAAKGLLHDVFGPLAPATDPDLQRNGVPFDECSDLLCGQRHQIGPVTVFDQEQRQRRRLFFAQLFKEFVKKGQKNREDSSPAYRDRMRDSAASIRRFAACHRMKNNLAAGSVKRRSSSG
jgi:hypothetical protein